MSNEKKSYAEWVIVRSGEKGEHLLPPYETRAIWGSHGGQHGWGDPIDPGRVDVVPGSEVMILCQQDREFEISIPPGSDHAQVSKPGQTGSFVVEFFSGVERIGPRFACVVSE